MQATSRVIGRLELAGKMLQAQLDAARAARPEPEAESEAEGEAEPAPDPMEVDTEQGTDGPRLNRKARRAAAAVRARAEEAPAAAEAAPAAGDEAAGDKAGTEEAVGAAPQRVEQQPLAPRWSDDEPTLDELDRKLKRRQAERAAEAEAEEAGRLQSSAPAPDAEEDDISGDETSRADQAGAMEVDGEEEVLVPEGGGVFVHHAG